MTVSVLSHIRHCYGQPWVDAIGLACLHLLLPAPAVRHAEPGMGSDRSCDAHAGLPQFASVMAICGLVACWSAMMLSCLW